MVVFSGPKGKSSGHQRTEATVGHLQVFGVEVGVEAADVKGGRGQSGAEVVHPLLPGHQFCGVAGVFQDLAAEDGLDGRRALGDPLRAARSGDHHLVELESLGQVEIQLPAFPGRQGNLLFAHRVADEAGPDQVSPRLQLQFVLAVGFGEGAHRTTGHADGGIRKRGAVVGSDPTGEGRQLSRKRRRPGQQNKK